MDVLVAETRVDKFWTDLSDQEGGLKSAKWWNLHDIRHAACILGGDNNLDNFTFADLSLELRRKIDLMSQPMAQFVPRIGSRVDDTLQPDPIQHLGARHMFDPMFQPSVSQIVKSSTVRNGQMVVPTVILTTSIGGNRRTDIKAQFWEQLFHR